MSIIPHEEQQQAIELALQRESFKVVAYAGTGKTTTLHMISDALGKRKGLYLAFNKAIATEASQKFPRHVDCRTFHSLAFRGVSRDITQKLSFPRLSPHRLASEYNLSAVKVKRKLDTRYEDMMLSATRQASMISDAISYFCRTSSQYPAPRHLQCPEWMLESEAKHLQEQLYPLVEKRWLDSINPNHDAGIGHDIYLKLWALSSPTIPADYILFDEAQDSDPIMLGVLLNQKNTQVIYTGDPHQQIYGWRGAINAMQRLPLQQTRLTRSFRFGQDVADIANLFLTELGETVPLLGDTHKQSRIYKKTGLKNKDAILCRTNLRAMELLVDSTTKKHNVALQADKERLLRLVQSADKLKHEKPVSDVPELAWFSKWQEVRDYSETSEGSDLKSLVKLVDEHGTQKLERVLSKSVEIESADFVISTAHKAKGLEWQTVVIEDDFYYEFLKEEVKIEEEELRLLYVAVTRAKENLVATGIADLIGHYQTEKILKPV